MKTQVLQNGLTVLFRHRSGNSVAIEITIGLGSNDEPRRFAGITHFLEHMVFEGTATRTAEEISAAVESVGGELNAMTTNERTAFYAKVPKKYFLRALDVLTDVVLHPAIDQQSFDKEKGVVIDELHMAVDQPTQYQWLIFEHSLFKKIATRHTVYGTEPSLKRITRGCMLAYYRKNYVPNNMTICIVGDIGTPFAQIKKRFGSIKRAPVKRTKPPAEPPVKKHRIKKVKRQVKQCYTVLGHQTVPRGHRDSYPLDVVAAILSKGLSGKIVEEIRIKRGLVYSIGTYHECDRTYGYLATQFNTKPKNLKQCKELVLQELAKIKKASAKDLAEAKAYLEGKKLLDDEDVERVADNLGFWANVGSVDAAQRYIPNIKKVSLDDVKRVANKYLLTPFTMAVVEPAR